MSPGRRIIRWRPATRNRRKARNRRRHDVENDRERMAPSIRRRAELRRRIYRAGIDRYYCLAIAELSLIIDDTGCEGAREISLIEPSCARRIQAPLGDEARSFATNRWIFIDGVNYLPRRGIMMFVSMYSDG